MSNPNASSASGQATVGQVQGRTFNRGARPQKIKFGLQDLDLSRGINHISIALYRRPVTIFIYTNSPRILPVLGKKVHDSISDFVKEEHHYYNQGDQDYNTVYKTPKITAEVDNGDKFCIISVCLSKNKYYTIDHNWVIIDTEEIEGRCQSILWEIDIETKAL